MFTHCPPTAQKRRDARRESYIEDGDKQGFNSSIQPPHSSQWGTQFLGFLAGKAISI